MSLQIEFLVRNEVSKEVSKINKDLDGLKRQLGTTSKSFDTMSSNILKLGAAYVTLGGAINITKDIYNTGKALESMNMALSSAVGSQQQAQKEMAFLKDTANQLGLNLQSSISGFTQFASATKETALEGKETRDIFKGVSSAVTVMGLSVDDTTGVFRALSQMMSKGTVQSEELKGQLGERLPGAFQIAARSMGVTTKELNKMLEQGQVLSDVFLPKFAEQLTKEFGSKIPQASEAARASQERFNNSLLDLKDAIAKSGLNDLAKDFFDLGTNIANAVGDFTKGFQDLDKITTVEDLQKRAESLAYTFEQTSEKIEKAEFWTKEFGKDSILGFFQFIRSSELKQDLEKITKELNLTSEQIAKLSNIPEFTITKETAKDISRINSLLDDANLLIDKKARAYATVNKQFGILYDDLVKAKAEQEELAKFSQIWEKSINNIDIKDIKVTFQIENIAKTIAEAFYGATYDAIRDGYEDSISSQFQQSQTYGLQSNIASSFGQSGTSAVLNYQKAIEDINLQKTLNDQAYELSKKSQKYKSELTTVFEVGGLAYAGVAAIGTAIGGSGALDGIEFALNASELADSMTGFSSYQQEYIDGVEQYKDSIYDLSNALIDISASVNDAIPTFQSLYDTFSGTDTYEIQEQINALTEISKYTSLDKNSLASFINEVLQAQKDFTEESVKIASGQIDEYETITKEVEYYKSLFDRIKGKESTRTVTETVPVDKLDTLMSTDVFEEYPLAIESLNETFVNSLGIIADLQKANESANESILDFAQTLKKELDPQQFRRETQTDFISMMEEYRKGNVEASELISVGQSLTSTLGAGDDLLRQNIIDALGDVAQPASMESLLQQLNNKFDEYDSVGLPVVNIEDAQSIEVQTLEEIKDSNTVLSEIVELLQDPFSEIEDFFKKIADAIMEGAEAIIEAILDLPDEIAKAIGDVGSGIADVGQDILSGIDSATGGIIGSTVGSVASKVGKVLGSFGFADGGFTTPIGDKDHTGFRVAGVVHEGEWVAPKWMVDKQPDFFRQLESARVSKGGFNTDGNYAVGGYTTYTPNVNVVNQVSTTDKDDMIIALMTEMLKINKRMYDAIDRIENNGVKTI